MNDIIGIRERAEAAGAVGRNGAPTPNAGKPWSASDDSVLTENYVRRGSKYTARLLGRTAKAVVQRAHELHVIAAPRRAWTPEEDEYLRRHYCETTAAELASDLDRTEQSVRGRIFLLGLTGSCGREWTDAEMDFLRKHYGKVTLVKIAESLGRTHASVEVKAARMRLRKRPVYREIGARDIDEIAARLGSQPATKIAAQLGIAAHTVYRVARDIGFRHRPTSRPWSAEDDEALRRLFASSSRAAIAAQLNRTELAITVRAQMLRLTRTVKRVRARKWSRREEARLRVLARRLTIAQIADRLDRSRTSIAGKMRLLGIKPLRKSIQVVGTGEG